MMNIWQDREDKYRLEECPESIEKIGVRFASEAVMQLCYAC